MKARLLALVLTLCVAGPAFAAYNHFVDLEHWDRRPVESGLALHPIMGAPALDAAGRPLGQVADVQFGPDGRAQAVLVNAGARLVPFAWQRLSIQPGERNVRIAGGDTPDAIPVVTPVATSQARPFRATEIIGDRAKLDDMTTTFGFVRDAVVDRNGNLAAVLVQTTGFKRARYLGTFPFPFYGYGTLGFNPANYFVAFPYNQERTFRYVERFDQLDVAGR